LPYALILLAGTELFIVGRATRATMDPTSALVPPAAWKDALATVQPSERVLMAPFETANLGMVLRFENLQGYDPGILKRYAEVIYVAINNGLPEFDLRKASQYNFFFRGNVPVFRMLRCRLVFANPNGPAVTIPDPLPQAVLVTDVFQPPDELSLLKYLCSDGFNPAKTAVTAAPLPIAVAPINRPAGTVAVNNPSLEELEIRATVNEPCLMVVTNNYSKGWRLKPIGGDAVKQSIIPVNHTQIGIPLEKGNYHFTLEYAPAGFRIGRWISLVTLLGYLTTSVLLMRRRLKFR
jgi:hypothetical protein